MLRRTGRLSNVRGIMLGTPPAQAEPVEPALAVSVIMFRSGARGLEVFIQNRVVTMDFAPGAVVFPGGRVDPVDHVSAGLHPVNDAVRRRHAFAWRYSRIAVNGPQETEELAQVLLAAAKREVQEESGVVVDVENLQPWANWVTPAEMPKRFDTYFYLAAPSATIKPVHQTTEADSSHWAPAAELLQAADRGDLFLMRPTRTLLAELVEMGDVESIPTHERSVVPVGFSAHWK